MTISDKVRQVAFTLAVGSVGAALGYVGNNVVEIIGEMRRESEAEEQIRRDREYRERLQILKGLNKQDTPSSDYQRPDPTFYCIGLTCVM